MDRAETPQNPMATPAPSSPGNSQGLETYEEELRIAKEAYQAVRRRQLKTQTEEYKHKTSMIVAEHRSQEPGEIRHHISVVKQEPGVSIPAKPVRSPEIIDLCESDSDISSEDTSESSPAGPSDPSPAAQASPSHEGPSEMFSPVPAEVESNALDLDPAPNKVPLPAKHARSNIPCRIPRGTIRPRPAKKEKLVVPASTVAPIQRSFWKDRLDAAGQAKIIEAPITFAPAAATGLPAHVDLSAITATTKPAKTKPKKPSSKPTYNHPYKYRGPAITVLSLQAIWDHLDQAWRKGSCTVKTIRELNSWWSTYAVATAHKLGKHQIWLLVFAQYKWWQALEDQWTKFEALPTRDRQVIAKMSGIRFEKHSKVLKAEGALVTQGLATDSSAVYRLVGGVKEEKVDVTRIGESEKKHARIEGEKGSMEREGEEEGAVKKRVRAGAGEVIDKEVGSESVEAIQANAVDEMLLSDSEEEGE